MIEAILSHLRPAIACLLKELRWLLLRVALVVSVAILIGLLAILSAVFARFTGLPEDAQKVVPVGVVAGLVAVAILICSIFGAFDESNEISKA